MAMSPNTRKGIDSKYFTNKRDSYQHAYEPLFTDGDQEGPSEPAQNDYHYSAIAQSKGKQKTIKPEEFYSRDQRRKAQSVLKTI